MKGKGVTVISGEVRREGGRGGEEKIGMIHSSYATCLMVRAEATLLPLVSIQRTSAAVSLFATPADHIHHAFILVRGTESACIFITRLGLKEIPRGVVEQNNSTRVCGQNAAGGKTKKTCRTTPAHYESTQEKSI